MKTFVSSVLAGISIGLGGLVFLSVENRVVGSALFTIGLFVVCTFGLHLFTGKVCYVLENDRAFALSLPLIWLGNLCGTGLTALCVRLSRAAAVAEKAAALCQVKTADSLLSLFFLGLLCNIFIYIAVEGYRSNPHPVGKYLSLFFGVMVFILCGTEHCVADMFYFWVAGAWSGRAALCLLVITLGNAVGSQVFPLLRRFTQGKSACQKSLAEFFARKRKNSQNVFSGGVYVGENTSQLRSVRVVRSRRTASARTGLQSPPSKSP